MKTIAILCGRYLPGYKDGGPVRTLINLTECLGEKYRFKIITNDRDHGDLKAYENIKYDSANKIGKAEVWYVKPKGFTLSSLQRMTDDADLIYICGPYNDYAYKTLFLKRIGRIKKPVVVASMGSFSVGALQIKSHKKKIFMFISKKLGLFKSITWSVTSQIEEKDVKHIIGEKAKCIVAEDLPRSVPDMEINREEKFKIVFVSRICEKKNLMYAIEVLSKLESKMQFDIYGILEDKKYWDKCKVLLEKLPENIAWEYKGMVDSQKVIQIFSQYDVFLFPTKGENYGHVIFEALAGGCIPIISDRTPWNGIEKAGCGKVISLLNKEGYVEALKEIFSLNNHDIIQMRKIAHQYAKGKYEESTKNTGYLKIFR